MEQRAGSALLSMLDDLEQGVDEGEQRLRRGLLQRLALMEQRCETLSRQAEALDFRSVLRRGFSLTMKDGRLVREAQQVRPGEVIQTILHSGLFQSRVLPQPGDE
jgi:exodeoxyribonuclease VII large subunit